MDINRSIDGALSGFAEASIGLVVTVDAYKHDDDDLAEFMDHNNDGYQQIIVDINDDSNLLWVKDCPYAIPPHIVYFDQQTLVLPNGREKVE